MAEKRLCRDFIKDPKVNPLDGRRLVPGKGPYYGYVALCSQNDFEVDYMLDEDFINSLSSSTKRSTSPARSPRNISIPRSPKSSALKSPLRSEPMLPARSFTSERSIPSSITPNNLPIRSLSDQRLNIITPETTQTLYPKVVGPSKSQISVNRNYAVPAPSYTTRSVQIGRETFDPDPVTLVTETPQQSIRRTVAGPYGNNGDRTVVSGVHKLPGQRVYTTADIPEHEVRSVHNGYNVPVNNGSPKRVLHPPPMLSVRTEQIGAETFNPDPVTTVTETPQQSIRRTVAGPYGANGDRTVVSGVHKLPGQRVYTTADIPEHEVRSVNNGYNGQAKRVLHPPPMFSTRSELIGNETFDPDPVTSVTETPSTSVRRSVYGPYGQSGETVIANGVHTVPGRRVYTTADIPEHEVRSLRSNDF